MSELVSILICAYNHERFVEATLDSIFKQDYRPLQIVISDDASSDATRACMDRKIREAPSGVTVVSANTEVNTGLAASLNRAAALAEGRIVIMLGGDDMAEPDRVSRTMAVFQAQSDVTLVWSAHSVIDAQGKLVVSVPSSVGRAGFYGLADYLRGAAPSCVGTTCAYDRRAFTLFAPLNESILQEDVILPLRCLALGVGCYLDAPLVRYRTHSSNMHFGGFSQTSSETATRIIYFAENRRGLAEQKLKDATRLASLGKPLSAAVITHFSQELRTAEVEAEIGSCSSSGLRTWHLMKALLFRRIKGSDFSRLFLLYVTPSAYLPILRLRIFLRDGGRR